MGDGGGGGGGGSGGEWGKTDVFSPLPLSTPSLHLYMLA